MRILWLLWLWVTVAAGVLLPTGRDLATGRKITATATCGEVNGAPIREIYCSIAGADAYSRKSPYHFHDNHTRYQEMRGSNSVIVNGQNCDYCEAGTENAHPASNMVDGSPSWWMSPPLSRGMQYHQINITIDLGQRFHIAYVWVQMANSPKPGTWILEKSNDFGKTYTPWQYYANSPAECMRLFGMETLRAIQLDDSVICTHEHSSIHPMEHGEIMTNLMENRPGKNNFSTSPVLQKFTEATNVRLRLISAKTLQGNLMDLNERNDPTVTRRYYYAIKEIYMGGRCVCHGHARYCESSDPSRPNFSICQCEHNTAGDYCDRCGLGFVQKQWRPFSEIDKFECEPCNCHGHSETCVYDEEIEAKNMSMDIHGNMEGGGKCLDCQDNTEGINCNKCKAGYFRPAGKLWNETNVCEKCVCDPKKHVDRCAEETGQCECLPQFAGPNCDQCNAGYYHPPECRPCDCHVDGTTDGTCLPINGQCPCKDTFTGSLCDKCAPGFTNLTAGCVSCECDSTGAVGEECDLTSGQCECRPNFMGKHCEECAVGYYAHPQCESCDCDPTGTEGSVCDKSTGQCLCKAGFAGKRCDQCDTNFFGYPNCRQCSCHEVGSKDAKCDAESGECPCNENFTSRTCDKCAPGYYHFPDCFACSCVIPGSKGVTCDNEGQCYCKPNFVGKHCESCKPNLYNYPICEECNCHPSGVIAEFAGCDKVPPGELCTCRENVDGRTCSQCKPTFWDLRPVHAEGCIDCNCNMTGTLSLMNLCDQKSGQCECKRFVGGEKCDQCADGFHSMQSDLQHGCTPCDCDAGGAVGNICHPVSGQCRCRPRVTGIRCDKPIKDHYFPTPWQLKYEAESGHQADGKPARSAVSPDEFPDFSYRGYAVFSPIQEELFLDVEVKRATVYLLLFHYRNPTDVTVDIGATFIPIDTAANDANQTVTKSFSPEKGPVTAFLNDKVEKAFVLNPGKWQLLVTSKKRLFLDYVVLVPAEYYEGSALKGHIQEPCTAVEDPDTACLQLRYPPMPAASRIEAASNLSAFQGYDPDGNAHALGFVGEDELPAMVGQAAKVAAEDRTRNIEVELEVPEDGEYFLLVEYFNPSNFSLPVRVGVEQSGEMKVADGVFLVSQCPYDVFCRELITKEGNHATLNLKKSPPKPLATFVIPPKIEFGIAAVNLIRKEDWTHQYLRQVHRCVQKSGQCIGIQYPLPSNSLVTSAGDGANANNSVSGNKLPITVENGEDIRVMPLDTAQSTVDISGLVTQPGQYVFVVQYYSPDNAPLDVDVLFQNEQFGDVHFPYCPSVTGCRAVIYDRQVPEQNYFPVEDKYTWSFYYNTKQKAPIYIESISAVPLHTFSPTLLKPKPLDQSADFLKYCSGDKLKNAPSSVSDFCREKVFALTAEFNNGALPCDCNPKGSTDSCCEEYGGECKCKPNVVGRTCDRCAPGFFDFPDCRPCECDLNELCDEKTGQCVCPPYVEGRTCEKCVTYAYGYDALIGCQLCGCQANGSYDGRLECDSTNGQCLCKSNVGGRRCEKCLPGFFSFPDCNACQCDTKGTTAQICNADSAECDCKRNVVGRGCETCRPGTFDLRQSHPDGCADCYCFGVTSQCHSSYFGIESIIFDENAWKSDDPSGTISADSGKVIYDRGDKPMNDVYLEVPIGHRTDFTNSYGLKMSFTIQVDADPEDKQPSMSADVRLRSGDRVFEFWAAEHPTDPTEPFEVVVTLLPDFWLTMNHGEPVSRAQLMLALLKLDSIHLKASYYQRPLRVAVENFQLESAQSDMPAGTSGPTASSVESCECPPQYTGASCQQCAPGFYRINSDLPLGSCVPCNCHDHSGTCDPNTGICSDCEHNTEGQHCERCIAGYYGNATNGSPHACLPCACPHPTDSNNFALSCSVGDNGILERCDCKPGYSGDRCEWCAAGFFGEPMEKGGDCKECFCNGNNDLSADGACNPQTGDCALCNHNTDGRACEYCREWFYGDAVTSKNCTECSCNKCGSTECNNQNGQCLCRPLVEGTGCDRCVENAWGYESCEGCRLCECGVAASNAQCDGKTGKCSCMPGATGKQCERCDDGYWDYGPEGCKKCDCEADLSMGTVCNVATGQCQCQEGATGPRCDMCIEGYLRIPGHGCRQCEECALQLNSEMDGFDALVGVLDTTLGNMSSRALTGARLNRIHKAVNELNPKVEYYIQLTNENQLGTLLSSATNTRAESSVLALRANRTFAQLAANHERIDQLFGKLNQTRHDANDLIGTANFVLNSIRQLVEDLQVGVRVESPAELITEAERLLNTIYEVSNQTAEFNVGEAEAKNIAAMAIFDEYRAKKTKLDHQMANITANLDSLSNTSLAYSSEISNVRRTIDNSKSIIDRLNLANLKMFLEGVEKDAKKKKELKAEVNAKMAEIRSRLEDLQRAVEEIDALKVQTDELRTKLMERGQSEGRLRRDTEPDHERVERKVAELEKQSQRIAQIYADATGSFAQSLDAATIYRKLIDLLVDARQKATDAQGTATSANTAANKAAAEIEQKLIELKDFSERLNAEAARTAENSKNTEQRASKLSELNERIERMSEEVNRIESPKAVGAELAKTDELASNANSLIERHRSSIEDFMIKVNETHSRVTGVAELFTKASEAAGRTRINLQSVKSAIPEAIAALNSAEQRIKETNAAVEECKSKLAALKEKVATIRDKANRVKLGAHFEKDSLLELPINHGSSEFGSYTDAKLFFRTKRSSGLLFYLGNEAGPRNNEFLAMEVEDSKPKLVASLGNDVLEIQLDDNVADNHWRQLSVGRVGKTIHFKVSEPNSVQIASNKTASLRGEKAVLNLYEESRHLFVGSSPADFRLPAEIRERSFVGDVDSVRLNGESLGLWNANNAKLVSGAEMRAVTDDEQAEQGITFNGRGFAQMGIGSWNPRKRTSLLLSFTTHAPDGLLFFVGKNRDQLVVSLDGGRVSLSFDLGSGLGKIVSQRDNYNDGQWHMVQINRQDRKATLVVDGEDSVDGESPGTMFEMSVSDSFYLGGLPPNVETRFTVTPFRGCLKNLKLDQEYIELRKAKSSKGVQNSCPNKEIRVASLVSERSLARWSGTIEEEDLEFSMRFRTELPAGHIATVHTHGEDLLRIDFADGEIIVRTNGEEEPVRIKVVGSIAGRWHYINVFRSLREVRVSVDDSSAKIGASSDIGDFLSPDELIVLFGKSATGSFIGCVGDVILNGRLLTFNGMEVNEAQLTGCTLDESNAAEEPKPELEPPADEEPEAEDPKKTAPIQKSNARSNGMCALPLEPHGEREDVRGLRFGLVPGSRLEFPQLPDGIEQNLALSMELRSNAANGIIFFVSNEKHTDHIALYVLDGKICLSYGTGTARLVIQSGSSILDDEWHSIRAEREGASATLYVDNQQVANDRVEDAGLISLEAPIYFGGLAKNLHSFTGRLLPGVSAEFGGCVRDLRLNDVEYDEKVASEQLGVVPCSQLTEDGLFFHKDGGYAMIAEFVANKQFHFELEIKPRVKSAVLLSVGVIDYVTMQLVNGSVKLTVDDGAGAMSIIYTPPQNPMICDGNWHKIKAIRKKSIVTLNVDGKSNLMMLKKKASVDSALKDPIYFGGVPKDRRHKGLDTVESYVGCMRIRTADSEPRRRRRELDSQQLTLFGALDRDSCPLN